MSALWGWMLSSASFAAVVLLSALAGWLVLSEVRARASIRRLADEAATVLRNAAESVSTRYSDPVSELRAACNSLLLELNRERALLRDEVRRRARAEEELRETQERYTLAVTAANEGMWEWNLKTGTACFSPRWKSMLGYAEAAIGEHIDEWRSRMHPDDRDRVLAELQSHLEGRTPRFECEHRIRQQDGTWRWVLARAAAVRHANGKPYRVVGLNSDISARKQVQELLLELADEVGGLRGDEACRALVRKFALIVGTREAFLSECMDFPTSRVRMLAYWHDGRFVPNAEFDLAGTPCEDVVCNGRSLFVPRDLPGRFPALRALGVESYLGLPCTDTTGRVIGHVVCKDSVEIAREVPHDAILRLFAVRASVELERRVLERVRRAAGSRPDASATPR